MEDKTEGKILKAVENLIDEDRVINFSDAVFAFAATLLVLKIELPAIAPADLNSSRLMTELINLWPDYFANIISFLVICYYWLNHHAIFSLIKKFNPVLIWLNVIFLIFISFLPFPVDLFGDYSNSDIIIAFYSLSLAIVGFFLFAIWAYASNSHRLIDPTLGKNHILYYSCRFLLAPVIFAISIPLAFVDPSISKASWVFVLIGILIINKMFHFKKVSVIEKESL